MTRYIESSYPSAMPYGGDVNFYGPHYAPAVARPDWWRCDACGCAVPFKSGAGATQLKCTECGAPIPTRYD